MKLSDPRLWLALLSTAVVFGVFLLDVEQPSPGPLSSVHGAEAALTGGGSCVACHGRRGESMSEACGACHTAIAEQLAAGKGLHGTRRDVDVRRCAQCHVEHHGDDLRLVDERAFARAGIADREQFDHRHVAYGLSGRHAELTCEPCHPHADAERLSVGQRRFLGLEQRCASCHEDPHEGRFVRGCAECHGQEQPFVVLAEFAHADSFPLRGAHGDSKCTDCHAARSEYSVEALGGVEPQPCPRECEDCHATPHSAPFLRAVAALVELVPAATCVRCHDVEHGGFSRERVAMPRDLHAAAHFDLAFPHELASCDGCHASSVESGAYSQRYSARRADDCAACHADPHGAQFATNGEPLDCLACHARERFTPSSFDLAAHARTSFLLDGQHLAVPCNDCHTRIGDDPRLFRGAPTDCAACHDDPHRGAFSEGPRDQDCGACHGVQTFAVAELASFEHERWTGFALAGQHATAACEACHVPTRAESRADRRLGFAAGERCIDCHADPHAGQFSDGGAGTDCLGCHDDRGHFELVGFDHARDSRFALDEDHVKLDCAACHVPWPTANGTLVVRYKPLGTECADCHGLAQEAR